MGKLIMTPLEALLKIKEMFAEMPVQEPAPEPMPEPTPEPSTFAEYNLASGAKVMIDKLEIGGKVVLVDEAGNEAPAPAGEHYLADGTKITLDETGTIIELEAPEAQPEPAPSTEPTDAELMKNKVAEMEAQIAELKKMNQKMSEELAGNSAKFSQALNQISDAVIELINTPSAKPTETPKDKLYHCEPKNAKVEKFLQFAKNLK